MQGDIEVWRGAHLESAHRLSIAVQNDKGDTVFEWGNCDEAIFPRSAVKLLQAMPLITSGAAKTYDLDGRMLALACASHSGEPEHIAAVADMLARAGLSTQDLQCGTQWPIRHQAAHDLAAAHEKPSQLHNTCSGKHAGFLLSCVALGYPTKDYVTYDHPIQRDIRQLIDTLTGVSLDKSQSAVDGCAIPSYILPLKKLARFFAKAGTGYGLAPAHFDALQQLREACANHPFYVAGTKRCDTKIMQGFGMRAFIKMGAEGVYVGIFPERALGFALKCEDGALRGAECAVANLIAAFLPLNESEKALLRPHAAADIKNANGDVVGHIQLNAKLEAALASV